MFLAKKKNFQLLPPPLLFWTGSSVLFAFHYADERADGSHLAPG
jgi:hypothetical protein